MALRCGRFSERYPCIHAIVATLAVLHASHQAFGVIPENNTVWLGGLGSWSNSNNWFSPFSVEPQVVNVLIDNGNPVQSIVFLDVNATIQSMTIDADDLLIILDGIELTVQGGSKSSVIDNSGLIRVSAQRAISGLVVGAGGLNIEGDGVIDLGASGNARIVSQLGDSRFTNNGNTIRGAGSIGGGSLSIINNATIQADRTARELVIDPNGDGLQNNGTMQAINGARLRLSNGFFDNSEGLIAAHDTTVVELHWVTVAGGALQSIDSGFIRVTDSPVTLSGVAIGGYLEFGATRLTLQGDIINSGLIEATAGISLNGPDGDFSEIAIGQGGARLLANGRCKLSWCKIFSEQTSTFPTLINGAAHTIEGEALIGMNTVGFTNEGTVVATGLNAIVIDPPDTLPVRNTGLLQAAGAAGIVLTGGQFRNEGVIEVTDGSRFVYSSNAIEEQVSNATLLGGTWRVLAEEQSAFILLPAPTVFFNEADILLSGANASFSLINTLAFNSGRFALDNGRMFTTQGAVFSNSGALSIAGGSRFTASGTYSQSATGELEIEVGPANAIPGVAGLRANAAAELDGSLRIGLAPGFQPTVGQPLHILSAPTISGQFDEFIAPPGWMMSIQPGGLAVIFTTPCPGDLDFSGDVGLADLVMLIGLWGTCSPPGPTCTGDLNHDGQIDISDLLILIDLWGPCA